jgi:hypothetical protein
VTGTWGPAANTGGQAAITTVACPSAGNCRAGGYYSDRFINNQALVVSEVRGTWRTARALPFPYGHRPGVLPDLVALLCVAG